MDGGEVNVNTLTSLNIINDLADSEGRYLAYGQTLAVLGELAPGYAGDACAAASVRFIKILNSSLTTLLTFVRVIFLVSCGGCGSPIVRVK